MQVRIIVDVLFYDRDKILLTKDSNPILLGKWTLPGGTRLTNQSLEETAVKRMAEKLGVQAKPGDLIAGIVGDSTKSGRSTATVIVFAFTSPLDSSKAVNPTENLTQAAWFRTGDLPPDIYPDSKLFIEEFLKGNAV